MITNLYDGIKIGIKKIECDDYIELIPDISNSCYVLDGSKLHTFCDELASKDKKPVLIILEKDKSQGNDKRKFPIWYQEVIAIMYIGNNREIVVKSEGMISIKISEENIFKNKNGDALGFDKIEGLKNDFDFLEFLDKGAVDMSKSFHLTVYEYDMTLEDRDVNKIQCIYEDDEIDDYDSVVSYMLQIAEEYKK